MLAVAAVPVGAVAVPAIVGNSAPIGLFLSCPAPLHATFGRAMKNHSFVGSLLTATPATGLLLLGSASASAQNTEHVPAQLVTGSTDLKRHTTTVRPPVLSKARVTCREEGALVVAKLRNPNTTVQDFVAQTRIRVRCKITPPALPPQGVQAHGES